MDYARAQLLASDLFYHVLAMLDDEFDTDGYDNGRIATIVERAFITACTGQLGQVGPAPVAGLVTPSNPHGL